MSIARRMEARVVATRERAAADDAAQMIEHARHGFSHRLRSAHSWIACAGTVQEVVDTLHVGNALLIAATLGGKPLRCADLRALGRAARLQDELLIVDNSLATSFGCQASLLGAHVTIETLDRVMGERGCGMVAMSVSRDARAICSGIWDRLDSFRAPSEDRALELAIRLEDFEHRLRLSNDAAQTTAFYLACHPRVAAVSYPGLPRDASHDVAARTLRLGFGNVLDFRLDDLPSGGVDRVVDALRDGFSELDASDCHETSASELGSLGMPASTCWFRLVVGPCDPREIVLALESALAW